MSSNESLRQPDLVKQSPIGYEQARKSKLTRLPLRRLLAGSAIFGTLAGVGGLANAATQRPHARPAEIRQTHGKVASPDSKHKLIIPNRQYYEEMKTDAQKLTAVAIKEWKNAKKIDRWKGLIHDKILDNPKVEAIEVVVPVNSNITGKKSEYVFTAVFPRGVGIKSSNVKTVNFYEPETSIRLGSTDSINGWNCDPGAKQPMCGYQLSFEHNTAADCNSPSTPTETRTLNYQLGVGWDKTARHHRNELSTSKNFGAGWTSACGQLPVSNQVEIVMTQATTQVNDAESLDSINLPKQLCTYSKVPGVMPDPCSGPVSMPVV